MEHVHGISSIRATKDVDAAVALDAWKVYTRFAGLLVREHGFVATRRPHRFVSPEGAIVDFIPFGGIENQEREIVWPPEQAFVMSTLGFREVFSHAEHLLIDGTLAVAVASLAGLEILKLLAWEDRRNDTSKDAEDFAFIMQG